MDIKATTIKEQLDILSKRNLILDSQPDVILLQYGYYNLINGYKDAFIDKEASAACGEDYYISGTKLSHLLSMYDFDDNLRKNILSCLIIIETQIKSLISLHFSLRKR